MNATAVRTSDSVVMDPFVSSRLSDRVRAILPDIARLVPEGERDRKPPKELVRLIREVGFWRHFVPAVYGGSEGDVYDWIQAVRLVASIDVSAAWTAGLISAHVPPLSGLSERAQDEIWADGPDTMVVTAGFPPPAMKRVDGGIILNGRMGFSSGCDHGDWLITNFAEADPATGEIGIFGALVPKSDFTIEDTWFISGMRGTGSNTVTFDDVFVPDHRCMPFNFDEQGARTKSNAAAIYRLSHWAIFSAAFAPIMIGALEASLQIHREAMQKKVSVATGKTTLDSVAAQLRFTEAEMKAASLIAISEARWRELDRQARAGEKEDIKDFQRWRAIDNYVAKTAVEIVEGLMNGSSPSAYYEKFPLQRFWRDIHTSSLHPYLNRDAAFQIFARNELALPRDRELMFG